MLKKLRPPKVHEKDGRYYYVDKNKWHPLSRVSDGIRELHRRLAILTDQPPNTLAGIFTAYATHGMTELKAPTRKQYEYFLFGILTHRFGHMMPTEIDEGTIAQYLEDRKNSDAAVSGNRERACLSSVFEFAMRKGWARRNPCRGVRRNRETPSKVMIESKSLVEVLDRAPPHFARVLQFAYMTGVRMVDVIALQVGDVTPEGIVFTESKTGKDVRIEWTETLRVLVRQILEARAELNAKVCVKKNASLPGRVDHDRLFTNRLGKPLTERGIISNMQRLDAGWSFRAIRAKAQTDAGDRNVLGHQGQMREVYTRRRKLVPVR